MVVLVCKRSAEDESVLLRFGYLESTSVVLESTMSRRSNSNSRLQVQPQQRQHQQQQAPMIDIPPEKQICCFCGLMEDNELEFGKFYHHKGIVTHYYCLLLSSNMEQKGNDDEGILGFLADDIHKEIRRGKRLVCSYCKKNGATLGCCNVRCKKIFHFPCGLKAGSLHQFFGEFRSYCISHKPRQRIDEKVKREIQNMTNILCYICYEDVEPLDSNDTMWAPCCKKNAWFHRKCVQQLAMSAGYFFKCPLCNNKREFQTAMLEYGIYIPRQDASWELVPNAFEELLYRHDRCDAKTCLCPKGRNHTSNNVKWELVLCRLCGSQGVHVHCGQLKWANPVWECQECITITRKSTQNGITTDDSTSNLNDSVRQDESNSVNITAKECDEDSDSDISVGNELVPQIENSLDSIPVSIPEIKLRPGPRSFKLQQVEKLKISETKEVDTNSSNFSHNSNKTISHNKNINQNSNLSTSSSSVSKSQTSDVICLDSDDETVEIVCESTMRSRSNRSTQFSTSNEASTGNSSRFSRAIAQNAPTISLRNIKPVDTTPTMPNTIISHSVLDDNEDSPFNIIISNVTSVPPEFFASVPEPPVEQESQITGVIKPTMEVEPIAPLKRTLPRDDENDCQIVVEAPKRARLDNISNYVESTVMNMAETDSAIIAKSNPVGSTSQSLSSRATTELRHNDALPVITGSSADSSSLDNCNGNAGTDPTQVIAVNGDSCTPANETDGRTNSVSATAVPVLSRSGSASSNTNGHSSKHATQAVLGYKNSYSSSSGDGGDGETSKSRSSSGDRSGLIPDSVYLKDLRFKIYGSDLELAYKTCKIHMKMNGVSSSSSLTDATSLAYDSESPFAGSNQNVSSEKSSKSFQLRSDDSDESNRQLKSLRTRTLRNFVYEDDNTLLEYPTSVNELHSNVRVTRKMSSLFADKTNVKLDRNELKENWDPEKSNSTNTFNSVESDNYQSAVSGDVKNNSINFHEKSCNGAFAQKENTESNQRLLRRSSRIIRHFRSVQHDQINSDLTDSNTNSSTPQSPEKSSPSALRDQLVKNSKSLKVLNNIDVVEQDKHLKNVDVNDLKVAFTDTINGTNNNNNNEIYSDAVFKISIDLQKIKNLISANPDLFFNTKSNSTRRIHVYRVDDKLRVESKSGERKLLTKSQSFGCLLDITKGSLIFNRRRSKSLGNLSDINNNDSLPLTDKKDWTEKKIKRNQLYKIKQLEKYECVR